MAEGGKDPGDSDPWDIPKYIRDMPIAKQRPETPPEAAPEQSKQETQSPTVEEAKKHDELMFKYPGAKLDKFEELSGYYVMGRLGGGTYGDVFKVRKEGRELAVKVMNIMDLSDSYKDKYMDTELEIMKSYIHPHIVHQVEKFVLNNKHGDLTNLYIVMAIHKGDMCDLIKEEIKEHKWFREERMQQVFKDVVSGLQFMHTFHNTAHRDLKQANILISFDGRALVSDFGLSKIMTEHSERTRSMVGSWVYMSPQMMEIKTSKSDYNPMKADIWALGIILFETLTKKLPFVPPADTKMFMQMRIAQYQVRDNVRDMNVSPAAKARGRPWSNEVVNLLKSLLENDEKKRFDIEQVAQHEWVRSNARYTCSKQCETKKGNKFDEIRKRELERQQEKDCVIQ